MCLALPTINGVGLSCSAVSEAHLESAGGLQPYWLMSVSFWSDPSILALAKLLTTGVSLLSLFRRMLRPIIIMNISAYGLGSVVVVCLQQRSAFSSPVDLLFQRQR